MDTVHLVLELDDLRRSYGEVAALDGLSFTVEPGRLVGFLGPNGAGKTTTMRVLMGLDDPDSGTATWNGSPIGEKARHRIGYLPEERGLYPKMRIQDQIQFFARLHGMDRAAAARGAHDWLERVELSDRAEDPTEKLSLGNQQRVQLAVALVHDPDLLILDEPFSGLDPIGADLMRGLLQERADAGATVVFSSHQLDLVQGICEDVVIINRGRYVVGGAVSDLRAAGPRRLAVGAAAGWEPSTPGVELVGHDELSDRFLLVLGDEVELQDVLADAQRAGPVDHFSVELAPLSDVFRQAVGP
ncbi:MAG: ATP-binding cassette domain-containing protein [Actinomycetota bacterium]|nr:ATP-binding cassette domain-containing protein [Actinomycetota bacterium]